MNTQEIQRVLEEARNRLNRPPAPPKLSRAELARYMDHTLLKPEATPADAERVAHEALEHGFRAVCVNPSYGELVARILAGSSVATCVVVGFPLGATLTQVKAEEAALAMERGATEVDMVIHIGHLKARNLRYVEQDIRAVREAMGPDGVLKVILETALLTDEEKVLGTWLVREAGAQFVKTSTGFGPGGATPWDVALLKAAAGDALQVKAAGGIRTAQQALEYIALGATRLGTSRSLQILETLEENA